MKPIELCKKNDPWGVRIICADLQALREGVKIAPDLPEGSVRDVTARREEFIEVIDRGARMLVDFLRDPERTQLVAPKEYTTEELKNSYDHSGPVRFDLPRFKPNDGKFEDAVVTGVFEKRSAVIDPQGVRLPSSIIERRPQVRVVLRQLNDKTRDTLEARRESYEHAPSSLVVAGRSAEETALKKAKARELLTPCTGITEADMKLELNTAWFERGRPQSSNLATLTVTEKVGGKLERKLSASLPQGLQLDSGDRDWEELHPSLLELEDWKQMTNRVHVTISSQSPVVSRRR